MVNLNKLYVNPIVGVAVLKYNLFKRLLKVIASISVCSLLLSLNVQQSFASDVRMACGTDGVIPDIEGLYIEEARKILFSHGWKPRDGEAVNNQGDMVYGWAWKREATPELIFCGRVCSYAYEDKGANLQVWAINEGKVTAVKGWCKI